MKISLPAAFVTSLCFANLALAENGQVRRRAERSLQGCASFPPNTLYHISFVHSGLNIGVSGTATGASVVQMAPGTQPDDNWRFVENPDQNGHFLVIGNSGLALSVAGGSEDNGADVVQDQVGSSQDGRSDWCFLDQGNGEYNVVNRKSGKSLDAEGQGTRPESNVHTWSFWGGGNQKVKVVLANEGPVVPTVAPPTAAPVLQPTAAPVLQPPPPGGVYSDWDGAVDTPVIAVGAANLPDGRIVMWSAASRNDYRNGGGQTWTATYDPSGGRISEKLVRTNHDMFCPGTATLADGTLMITGGSNSEATSFFDYRNNNWSSGPRMEKSRGYHSMTVLADGSVFTCGGSWSGGRGNKDGELWSPSNNWNLLSGVPDDPLVTDDDAGFYRSDNHMWLFLAPNGKVFHAGPSKRMHWITTTGNGSIQNSGNRGNDDHAMNGNALMYDIGKILTIGGTPHYDSGATSNRAYIIDINGSQASVTRTGDMEYKRVLHNSVLLPSAEVVVIGGRRQLGGGLFSDRNSELHAEIWNPATGTFKTLKEMGIPRNYHSVALLMKDGRVWAAGGGLCGGCNANHQDFEIMTPPYLYNSDGSLATQPVIVSAPGTTKAGGTISVLMNSNQNHSFALVRVSAVTHSVNNDQRRIPLQVASKNGSTFSLKLPSNTNVSLLGVYYLFAMNGNGVPSVAKDIRIAL